MRGAGSITRLGPDRWRVRVEGPKRGGKRSPTSQNIRGTREDAEKLLARLILKKGQKRNDDAPANLTFEAFVRDWYLPHLDSGTSKHGRDYAPRTRQRYADALRAHVLPHIGHLRVAEIDLRDIEAMQAALRGSGLSPASIGDVLAVAKAAFTHADMHRLLPDNPFGPGRFRVPRREPQREIPVVPPDAVRKVLTTVQDTRFHIPVLLAFAYGLRREEILGLRWSDIDFDTGYLHVRRTLVGFAPASAGKASRPILGPPKTRGSDRRIPLLEPTIPDLMAARRAQRAMRMRLGSEWHGPNEPGEDLVVAMEDGRAWRPDSYSRAWRRFAKTAGHEMPDLTTRDGRAAWVSNGIAGGVDPKVLAIWGGHSPKVQRAHYQAILPSQVQDGVKALTRTITGPTRRAKHRRPRPTST